MSSEDALANAKKLVNDLNDASTGTVTSYQPGREKEPVTCNEIMAKSLVVANEEKAAVIAEKNAVVKAAALLAEKIDDLTAQLKMATEEISKLEQSLVDQSADCEAAMIAHKKAAMDENAEMERELSDANADHEMKFEAAMEEAERDRQAAEQILSDTKAGHEAKLKAVVEDATLNNQEAQQKVLAEKERSRLNMDALKNATSASIAKIEKETAEKFAMKEKEVAKKIEETEQEVITIQTDAQDRIDKSQKGADDKIASIIAKAEKERESIMEYTQKQIDDAKMEAKQKVDRVELEMADNKKEHQQAMTGLEATHAETIKEVEEIMEKKVQEVHDEMEKAIAKATMKISLEQEVNKQLQGKLQKKMNEAQSTQKSLRGDLETQRSNSFKLEKEVSFWKETYESQGYCNTTLIKEDSRKFVTNALSGASRGLDSGHKTLMAGLGAQLELIQKTGGDIMLFIEKDLLPNIERIIGEGCDKAMAMYDKHLAAAVNENLIPLYNDQIYPVYNNKILPLYVEHVSPVVKTIEGEAAVAIQKSQEGVDMARSKAASLVKEASSMTLDLMEDIKIDRKLPVWLYELLNHSSVDGEWAVGILSKGLLILIVILCRSLITRIIGAIFSLVWFFCPLRLFVGGRQKTAENDAKENSVKSRTNGKVKVY